MVIPLVAAGMAAMVGCSKTPVKEAAKNDAINLANLDTAVAPGTDFYLKRLHRAAKIYCYSIRFPRILQL